MTKQEEPEEEPFVEPSTAEEESEAYDWENLEPEEASKILKGIEAIIPDIIKKTVVSGVGNILLSEEAIRNIVGEKKLPKEAVGYLLNQGDAMRKEILRIASNEIRIFLENMDFGGEIAKILTTLSFEIKTEVRFVPNEERVVPQVRNRVKIKKNGETVSEADETEDLKPELKPEKKPVLSRWRRRSPESEEEE